MQLCSGIFFCILIVDYFFTDHASGEESNYRIVEGTEIDIENVPWIVSMFLKPSSKFFCAGVIIGRDAILSAGHCIRHEYVSNNVPLENLRIRAGSTSKSKGGTVHRIVSNTRHPLFEITPCQIKNDLSFLRITPPFKFNKKIQKISLARVDPENGQKILAAGWGKTTPGYDPQEPLPDLLRSVNLSVWDKNACYKNFGIPGVFTKGKDILCISNMKSGGFESTCQGDSGGPISRNNKLVGIVQGGVSNLWASNIPPFPCQPPTPEETKEYKCNHEETVAIYTSVPYHRGWITEMLYGE